MKTSFFHQAHLNNWQTYLDALSGSRWQRAWDDVVLTAANERQAAAFRYQLQFRRELEMLPPRTRFHVIPDPDGIRIGSGGATLNAMRVLARECGAHHAPDMPPDHCFADRRILILHSGGDSKRLPQYSAFGKVFAPIPRLLGSGRPSTLFDELFVALSGLPGLMDAGTVIASGDVLLLFDHSQMNLVRPGLTGVAIGADIQTASHHGVFIPDENGRVRAFLHKPSPQFLKSLPGDVADSDVPVDTGIVYIDAPTTRRLWRQTQRPDSVLHQAIETRTPINFYGDFLLPLSPAMQLEAYLQDTSDGPATQPLRGIRRTLWDVLRDVPFYVGTMRPAKFLHFGTSREYQRLITYDDEDIRALGGRRRISHVIGEHARVEEAACVLHSSVGSGAAVKRGVLLEFSEVGNNSVIAADSLVSNTQVPPDTSIPANLVVHSLPVRATNGSIKYVVRLWGIDDNPKAPLPEATLFGRPLAAVVSDWGIDTTELWPHADHDCDRTLWDACLFPAAESAQAAWTAAEFLLDAVKACGKPARGALERWRAASRMSLHSSYEAADLEALGRSMQELFANLVFEKCRQLFAAEAPAELWFDKIPTHRDLHVLVDRMDRATEAIASPLDRMRWQYSAAVLLRKAGQGDGDNGRARGFEDCAFRELAHLMLDAQARQANIRKVSAWALDAVDLSLPVRLDFAGGWSDTPPYSIERGGTVLNAAVSLDGRLPVGVTASRLAEPAVVLESRDLGVVQKLTSLDEILDFANPHDPLAIHKAAFVLAAVPDGPPKGGLDQLCDRLGGGLHLTSDVRLPKGSGLGTSSILAAGLAKGLLMMGYPRREPDLPELFDAAAAIEQMLTTGGGWQDQVGGLAPGLKLTRSEPGDHQKLRVTPLDLNDDLRDELDRRLVVIDTGQRRLAKNLLRQVMGKWLARDQRTVTILNEIQQIARDMTDVLEHGGFDEAGSLMWRHWQLNQELDCNTSNHFIDQLMTRLKPCLAGAKLAGAGGGGYMLAIARDDKQAVRSVIESEYAAANVTFHDGLIFW